MNDDSFSLVHIRKLDQGKQGITGLVKVNDKIFVYKLSQHLNYLTNHEFLILNGLLDLKEYCPHFCTNVFHRPVKIHPNFRRLEQNPFESSEKPILIDVLFMEYIPDSLPLYRLIENKSTSMAEIMSCVKQVLTTLIISQKDKKFAHYDLHSMNILMRDCDIEEVHLYRIDEENIFCIPTYGYVPVIIDYGFSTSSDLLKNPCYISLAFTDSGYMSPAYDPIADAKLFLISVAEDLRVNRSSAKQVILFRNIVKNLFQSIKELDWKSGWDKNEEFKSSLLDDLFYEIDSRIKPHKSSLFTYFPHICIDILHTLVWLPMRLGKRKIKTLVQSYNYIINEVSKIERELNDSFYTLFVLRKMVDFARAYKSQFELLETREQAIINFERDTFDQVRQLVSFVTLKDVNFHLLLCSLLAFGEQLEYHLAYGLDVHMKRKFEIYSSMPIQRTDHIYALFDMNFKDSYIYNSKTKIYLFDRITKTKTFIDIDEEIAYKINRMPQHTRGMFLYDLLQRRKGSVA
jgi:hypothetical protein